jgi:SAM-dependent methyltransferase
MKNHVADYLICPDCLPEQRRLALDAHESHGTEVVTGVLRCLQCRADYPITGGIAILLPREHDLSQGTKSKYEEPEVVSSYLWSHYADLFSDEEAASPYSEWAAQLLSSEGFALDAGCAVGRFTFELSRKCDFAIGFDYSRSFVTQARKLLIDHRLDFDLKLEGHLSERRTIKLREAWDGSKIEFIVADAQALPFPDDSFSLVASLNLLDKLSKPLTHLKEMSRTANKAGAQILVSDPFSWSTEYTKEEDWLGGSDRGEYTGRGLDNVQTILEDRSGGLSSPWTVEQRGAVWWKIRNHDNHFELIQSRFIKAHR